MKYIFSIESDENLSSAQIESKVSDAINFSDNCVLSGIKVTGVKRLRRFQYYCSTSVIWGSFDHGEVFAETLQEATRIAKEIIRQEVDKANKALVPVGISIGINLDEIEITEL